MFINKELAIILKENGYDVPIAYNNVWLRTVDNEPCLITEHEVLDWIFSKYVFRINNEDILTLTISTYREWLRFWYTTLLDHKFNLMYEFIGRLDEWFNNNNIYLTIMHNKSEGWCYYIFDKNDFSLICYDDNNIHTYYKTKQQATHEAILKCF